MSLWVIPRVTVIESAIQSDNATLLHRHVAAPSSLSGLGGQYDLVFCLGLLHHLSDAQTEAMVSQVRPLLAPGARFVALEAAFVPRRNPIAKFLARRDRGEFIRTAEGYRALIERHFSSVRTVIIHDFMRVPYTHLKIESSA
jgi:2-polyprenyl-3-methyl-5-hydroxy-6-metoxy-1,4-benzoquinol methylase